MQIDKQNGNICFNDLNHKYFDITDESKQYISVTTLIGKYGQDFDKDFWSAYKALEKLIPKDSWAIEKKSLQNTKKFDKKILKAYNISENAFNKAQQDTLDEWDKKNKEACERGTKIHSDLENSFYNAGNNVQLKKFGIGGKFVCKKDYNELDLDYGVYPEYLISWESADKKLLLAGQIDLLIKSGNDISIIDHKGLPLDTPISTIEGFKTMADLKVGDKVFDKDGNLCNVIVKSEVHHNPCYKIDFDNTDSIVADCEHRWLVSFSKGKDKGYKEVIITTEELAVYIEETKKQNKWYSNNIPKILNTKPLNLPEKRLPIDPYVLGCWLGDGSKSCGIITNSSKDIWKEIKSRGFAIGPDVSAEDGSEMYTVYGLSRLLKSLNLIGNKHIPDVYLRASYEQRLSLLRGLMDTDGYYNPIRKRFVMTTDQLWQKDGMVKLLSTLGIKPSVFSMITRLGEKEFNGWNLTFSTLGLNPFLTRNQNIEFPSTDKSSFRIIKSVTPCKEVPTQCIAVDSPSHTYLAGYNCIVTHNTNAKIDTKSAYDSKTKTYIKMKYPLNNLMDTNYYHYELQLSTYAWMLQKLNPNFVIKDLILNHYDHEGNNTIYHCDYLKHDVEKMLVHYKKNLLLEQHRNKRKRIEY